jgi:hypothetical protein
MDDQKLEAELERIFERLQQEGLTGPVSWWLVELAARVYDLEAEIRKLRPKEGE